jgi:hypothetical protein
MKKEWTFVIKEAKVLRGPLSEGMIKQENAFGLCSGGKWN